MEKRYKIKYKSAFYKDLISISNYIKNELQNEIAANNLVDLVEEEIIKRAKNPIIYEQYESNINSTERYYKIHIKNYIVFYVVYDDIMEVRRIMYNRRNFTSLLY